MSETTKPLRMNAYYFSFTSTGVREIDIILSAVACAGKAFHHTESWSDDGATAYQPEHRGNSCVEWIQNAADDAAKALSAIRQEERERIAALASPSQPSEPGPFATLVPTITPARATVDMTASAPQPSEPAPKRIDLSTFVPPADEGDVAAGAPQPSEPESITPEELERIETAASENSAPNLRKALARRQPSEPEGRCASGHDWPTDAPLPCRRCGLERQPGVRLGSVCCGYHGHGGATGEACRPWPSDAAPPPPAKPAEPEGICGATRTMPNGTILTCRKVHTTRERHLFTPATPPAAEDTEDAPLFVIRKRGLFWAPDSHGYTSSFLNAGVYDKAEADSCRLNPENTVLPLAEALTKYAPPSGPVHPRSVAAWLKSQPSPAPQEPHEERRLALREAVRVATEHRDHMSDFCGTAPCKCGELIARDIEALSTSPASGGEK